MITVGINGANRGKNVSTMQVVSVLHSCTVAVFSSTAPSCFSQANDTFAGDHLLQSFQRLAMILANTSNGIESYQRSTFGEAFTDILVTFETESFQSSRCTQLVCMLLSF